MFNVRVKSGPPTGRGAAQFDGPLSMVLSYVKYPACCSDSVGPAIKSWMEKVPTAIVGDVRSTAETAEGLLNDSGDREKKTLMG